MSDPAEDFAEPYDEDLIGAVPRDHPIDRFQPYVEAFRDMSADDREFSLRQIAKVDIVTALHALIPDAEPGEHADTITRYKHLRADRRARDMLAEDDRADLPDPPGLVSLSDFLAEPDEEVRYRVDGLWPTEGRIVLAAQNKSGKTTLTANLIRSLADGDPFLDTFDVERADRVVLLDNEMSPSQIRRWLRDQGIRKTDAVDLVSLRGRVSSFNILDPAIRAEWANLIGPADVLIFDCLRPALDALGLSEDKESGRFLEALDELIYAAGIPELVLVHHMGHSNERSRGDSRLEDWPDAKWKLVKQPDPDDPDHDEQQPRFFSAFGRDVDQSEVRLAFDPDTRHLRVDGGSRKATTNSRIENAVQLHVTDNPGCSQGQIEKAVEGDNTTIRKAIRVLAADNWLRVEKQGSGRATLHYPAEPGSDFSENVENLDVENVENQ